MGVYFSYFYHIHIIFDIKESGIGTLFYENEDRDTNTVIGEIHGSM